MTNLYNKISILDKKTGKQRICLNRLAIIKTHKGYLLTIKPNHRTRQERETVMTSTDKAAIFNALRECGVRKLHIISQSCGV